MKSIQLSFIHNLSSGMEGGVVIGQRVLRILDSAEPCKRGDKRRVSIC